MDPTLLFSGYAAAIVLATFVGIWLENVLRLTHTRVHLAMSFVAGFVLGVALFHLLPHGIEQISGPEALDVAIRWAASGMILMVLLLRVFRFHQHDLGHGTVQGHRDHREGAAGDDSLSWAGVCAGMAMHTLTEGTALGAAARSSLHDGAGHSSLVSLGIFLSIVFHKPLDALSILGLMRISGVQHRPAMAVTAAIALLCPLSALATYWGIGFFGSAEADAIGRALALGAGALLCVALSDLLPEIQFHGHNRILLTVAFGIGLSLSYALRYLEGALLP